MSVHRYDLKLLIAGVLALLLLGAAPASAPTKAPALKERELVLVYLSAFPSADKLGKTLIINDRYIAPECPSGPYEMKRFLSRAELDLFLAREKPFVFAVLTRVTEDAGIWTAWPPCAAHLNEERKKP